MSTSGLWGSGWGRGMADLNLISTVLSSIKAATDLAKIVRESVSTLEQAEYKLKLAELIEKLADAKTQMLAVRALIEERDRQILELKEAAAIKNEKLLFEAPYYWLIDGESKEGPFCQQCYDEKAKLMRLTNGLSKGYWECKTCRSVYIDAGYHSEMIDRKAIVDYCPY